MIRGITERGMTMANKLNIKQFQKRAEYIEEQQRRIIELQEKIKAKEPK